jgi:thiamine transport system substrate-binding protein
MRRFRTLAVALVALALFAAACSDDKKPAANASASSSASTRPVTETITLVTHDAFAASDKVLQDFTNQTGIAVKVVKGGDAGQMVNQAILTKDNPQGDVLYGIDNTLLTKGADAGLFEDYSSPELPQVDQQFVADAAKYRVTPIDESDVCLNYDMQTFGHQDESVPPTTLEDVAKPDYKDQLVVENPATSSTGLAFLVATVQRFGEDHYLDYWKQLRDNGVKVVDTWDEAYNDSFTAGSSGNGDRPIVVSYATSPPADVVYADPPKDTTNIGVVDDGCFQQIEYAGVLAGTKHQQAARTFIDFMLSKEFQEDMPLQMFVYPVRTDATLPDVFTKFSARPTKPLTADPAVIGASREKWINDWTSTVLG